MVSEKIKNIAVTVAAVVISVVSAVTAYHVIGLIKDTRQTLSKVDKTVGKIANDYKLDPNSWLGYIIKANKKTK